MYNVICLSSVLLRSGHEQEDRFANFSPAPEAYIYSSGNLQPSFSYFAFCAHRARIEMKPMHTFGSKLTWHPSCIPKIALGMSLSAFILSSQFCGCSI